MREGGLQMGTADPHGVGEEESRVPPPRTARGVLAHVAASEAELLARRMAPTNVAPVTTPRPPPEVQPVAPLVTSVSQVVTDAGQSLVRRWWRMLRRAYRAARAGDLSRARRLRPDDLWLAHEHYSVAETALWDWDLRPLARGEPAIALPVSGRAGVLPSSSLIMHAVLAAAEGFADAAVVEEMVRGVEDDSCCARGTLLCAPHIGAFRDLAIALEKTEANVAKGWATGGHELPCWPLRTCPFSVVDESLRAGKPKYRLTTDLSWPHPGMMVVDGVEVDAVNSAMDRSEWPANRLVRVTEYAEAVAILQGAARRRRVRVWGLDCEAFYRCVGRQRRELWRNGVCLPDGVQLDERCCFGDASAAVKCARMSNLLVHAVRRALAAFDAQHPVREEEWVEWQRARRERLGAGHDSLFTLSMYIDDAMGGSADDLLFDVHGVAVCDAGGTQLRRAQRHFEIARAVIESLGWKSAPSKEQPPSERIESLGVLVTLRDGRLRLTDAKRARYALRACEVLAMRSCPADVFAELLGRLQFASQCYPLGQQHMHALWRVSRATFRLASGHVRVTRAVSADLQWWVSMLGAEEHEGVPMAASRMARPTDSGTGVVYADASGEGGYAAWTLVGSTVLATAGAWSAGERGMLICDLELLASTFGLVAFSPWLPRDVYSFTDNTVAQAAMSRLSARSPAAQAMLQRRTEWMVRAGHVEAARRISTAANRWADIGSRPELGGLAEVERQARAAGLQFVEVAVPPAWRDTTSLLEPEPVW